MGWDPARLLDPEFLILSTHGGLRAENGEAIALGFHTGHWEVGLLVAEAARELKALRAIPFAGACTDPCDGRTQGTTGMLDSLPFRNDAAIVLRRLMRSLPTGKGVHRHCHLRQGPARHDDGAGVVREACRPFWFPAALRCCRNRARMRARCKPSARALRRTRSRLNTPPRWAAAPAPLPGGGCQFLGTAATSQVVGEALGLALPHTALAPSGQPIWLDAARRSARAILRLHQLQIGTSDILTQAAIRNAMVVHAAFGGSTNLLLHVPAIAFAAKLQRPTVDDWAEVNRQVPRLVDALPNGPRNFATVQVFLAGGVPEVMLHLRRAGLLDTERQDRHRRNARRVPRLVAAEPSPRSDCAAACASRTASIRTT